MRPGQHLAIEIFKSEKHRHIYQNIKALKTILDIDLNNYMLKKLLLKQIVFNTRFLPTFLHDVICMSELHVTFEARYRTTKSGKRLVQNQKYPLKNEENNQYFIYI